MYEKLITITKIIVIIMIMSMLTIIIENPITNKEKRNSKLMTEIKHAKVFMIPHTYLPTFLPRYTIFNPSKKQLHK